MNTYIIPIIAVLTLTVRAGDDCPSKRPQTTLGRLRNHLLCDYDKNIRPITDHKKAIKLAFQMIVKYITYDMHDNSFTVNSWMPLTWQDENLKWDPSSYDSIRQIYLSDGDIWMPDFHVFNRRNQGGDQSAIESATCRVTSLGQVTCVPSVSHTSICTSDLSKYPFDVHNCSVRFGSWIHSGEELDIRVPKEAISMTDLVANSEWEVVASTVIKHPGVYDCCPNDTYPSIDFTFKIKRRSSGHVASVILPAIVVITLTSMWMSPENQDRLSLCFVNLISQFMYVQYVSWMLPLNGDNVPLILLFARDSLLLCAFTIVITLTLKSLTECKKTAPVWMSKTVDFFGAFGPVQFVFISNSFKGLSNENDDVATIITNQEAAPSKAWAVFAKILDRLCFAIYFIVYFVMFIGFTP